jgi:osmotically-inducible protein OsmY
MNKMFPVVLAFASFVGPAGVAQPVPTDTKILHDASAALETEKAFRGLLIVPSVSHGVVTLTGTVSSEGDKVLASVEVGSPFSCCS